MKRYFFIFTIAHASDTGDQIYNTFNGDFYFNGNAIEIYNFIKEQAENNLNITNFIVIFYYLQEMKDD